MSDTRKRLVDFNEPNERPSVTFAKHLIQNINNDNFASAADPKNILNGYEDSGYAPNLSQIEDWVSRETKAMREALDADICKALDPGGDFDEKLSTANDIISKGTVDASEMIQVLAELYSFLDQSPFWRGMPLGKHWHAANAQSAQLLIGKECSMIIDVLYDLIDCVHREHMRRAEAMITGEIEKVNVIELKEESEQLLQRIETAASALNKIRELAVKVGFLYRDSWWLDTHGEAALKGYIARETSEKAGVGGAAASSSARMKKIRCFLEAHANLIRNNRALTDFSPEDVAYHAIKLARKAHPKTFGKTGSRKTAYEYWEYIKSDEKLWREYQDLLFNNNGMR